MLQGCGGGLMRPRKQCVGVRLPECQYKELDKSSPRKTMTEMDTVFKNNNFDTLEIEQGDAAN